MCHSQHLSNYEFLYHWQKEKEKKSKENGYPFHQMKTFALKVGNISALWPISDESISDVMIPF
jgi:hypothetical protein